MERTRKDSNCVPSALDELDMAALGEDTLADKDLHPELQGVREREKGVTYDRRGRMCEFVSLTG